MRFHASAIKGYFGDWTIFAPPLLIAIIVAVGVSAFPSRGQADHTPEHTQYLKACGESRGFPGAPFMAGCATRATWNSWTPEKRTEEYNKVAGDLKTAEENRKKRSGETPAPVSCNGWREFFGAPATCFGRMIGAFTAALLMKVAVWTLATVGTLFNSLLDYTVVHFADKIYNFGAAADGTTGSVRAGVENAWQVFRDVSNIIIIGMFTFIAINIILGNQTYGTKKLVATVLVIATLINFSLLFTKVIIDTSNFSALVFYNAAAKLAPGGTGAGTVGGAAAEAAGATGIAGAFVAYMGVAGFGDTYTALTKLADAQNDGILAFLYGLFSATLILAVAGVLLYGSLLLVGRAVMLIVLMMLSSLAFASHLVPSIAEGEWGWSAWWKQLIKNALFGPLLMMFFWGTLMVASALKTAPGGGTLGQLIADPTKPVGIAAFINYLIVLGLLYASIKIADSFSTSGARWLARATIGTAAAATFGAVGLAGRFTLGAGAARLLATERVANMEGFFGRGVQGTLKRMATASYEGRGIPGVASGSKLLGINAGKAKGEGGYVQSFEDRMKRNIKREAQMAELIGRKTGADIRAAAQAPEQIEKESAALNEAQKQQKLILEQARTTLAAVAEEAKPQGGAPGTASGAASATPASPSSTATPPKPQEQPPSQAQQQQAQNAAGTSEQARMSEQKHRIGDALKEAIEKGTNEAYQQVADLIAQHAPERAKELRELGEQLEKTNQRIAGHQANIRKLSTPPDEARQEAYLKSLGNKRYLNIGLGLTTTFSPGIAEKVAEQVKMPATEKFIRDLIKGNQDTKKTADAAKAAAERAAQAGKPAS